MFENCTTLAELNAARIKATTEPDADLITINNFYNERRQELLASRAKYKKLTRITAKPVQPIQYCGVPVVGRSSKKGCIQLTPKGFLY